MSESNIVPASGSESGRTGWARRLGGFHKDQQGDEGVNKILIIALIVVPLVIIILIFGKKIAGWFQGASNNMTNEQNTNSINHE